MPKDSSLSLNNPVSCKSWIIQAAAQKIGNEEVGEQIGKLETKA